MQYECVRLCFFCCVLPTAVDIRVYVVPTKVSSLGNYLALTDPWYRRQVFSPFNSGIGVLPKLQLSADDLDTEDVTPPRSDIVTPTYDDLVPVRATADNEVQRRVVWCCHAVR